MNRKIDEFFAELKSNAEKENLRITDIKDISYGKQFRIKGNLIRLYSNRKKGFTLDTSTSKDSVLNSKVNSIFYELKGEKVSSPDFNAGKKRKSGSKTYSSALLKPPLAGSDEVGKGDYFTPMIVTCLFLDEKEYETLTSIGVTDSKKLSDSRIRKYAAEIRKITSNYVSIGLSQKNYNAMYSKTGNINIILANQHIAAAKRLYQKIQYPSLLIDRFGREMKIMDELKDFNLNIQIEPKAERNTAVAASSIISRDILLNAMKNMEEKYSMHFPLGAGEEVIQAGREFVRKYGKDELFNIAKYHFKTTNAVLRGSGGLL